MGNYDIYSNNLWVVLSEYLWDSLFIYSPSNVWIILKLFLEISVRFNPSSTNLPRFSFCIEDAYAYYTKLYIKRLKGKIRLIFSRTNRRISMLKYWKEVLWWLWLKIYFWAVNPIVVKMKIRRIYLNNLWLWSERIEVNLRKNSNMPIL